jgi:hypothetical protein
MRMRSVPQSALAFRPVGAARRQGHTALADAADDAIVWDIICTYLLTMQRQVAGLLPGMRQRVGPGDL